ncbi:DNA ligase 1-like isoform X2 [Vigna radiata var. radiata]|uniref:DNA ligase 1-like isoform X2 n=1 Tax=Vigna radiata var. radiata TaxID=3916 RepID=A0A3Q0EM94_VIGRR|nr:DNA ligase 1-like isoform X2 [Vigna radiata var. radiata]
MLKKTSVSSFILDCEIVAYDRATQKLLSFLTLSTQARKKVEIEDIIVNVCVFAFDLLHLNMAKNFFRKTLESVERFWRRLFPCVGGRRC